MIKVDLSHTVQSIPLEAYCQDVQTIDAKIKDRSGLGNDFLGWVDYPSLYDRDEFRRILEAAKEIRERYEVLVVAGIGGSYLGSRAAI